MGLTLRLPIVDSATYVPSPCYGQQLSDQFEQNIPAFMPVVDGMHGNETRPTKHTDLCLC